MALTKVSRGLLNTSIVDNGNATAITIDSSENVTFSGAVTAVNATFTTADNSDNLTLASTDADASFGPNIRMYRNSGSPADNDLLGNIEFEGRNDNSQDVVYGRLFSRISDASDGSEDGIMRFDIMKAGSLSDVLTINSDEIIVNDGSYDYDFRVESNGNANMLFVDGGEDRVGVGTNSPNALLHVGGTAETQGSQANPAIQIGSTTGYRLGMYTDAEGGYIENKNGDNGLIFKVKTVGEAMRIDGGTGNVGIGIAPASAFSIYRGSGVNAYIEVAGNNNTPGSTSMLFGQDSGNYGYCWNRANQALLFGTNGTERLRIDQHGGITGTMLNATNGEYDGNLNDLKKTGFYRSKNTNSNNPSFAYYSVVVYGNQGNVTAQIATLLAGPATYVRSFNVSWTSWVRIDD